MFLVSFFGLFSFLCYGQNTSNSPQFGAVQADLPTIPFVMFLGDGLLEGDKTAKSLIHVLRRQNPNARGNLRSVILHSELAIDKDKLLSIADNQSVAKNVKLDVQQLRFFLKTLVSEKMGEPLKAVHISVGLGHFGATWHFDPRLLRKYTLVWPLGPGATGVRYRFKKDSQGFSVNMPSLHNSYMEHSHGSGYRLRVWFDKECPNK